MTYVLATFKHKLLGQKKCDPRKLNQNFSLLLKQSCFIWPWASSRRQSHPYILVQLEPGLCWCGKHFLRSTEFTFKLRRAQRRIDFWWYFYTKQQPTIQTADTVLVLRNLGPVPGTARFLPGTAPARPEHTAPKSILCKDRIAFRCWGKKLQDVPNQSNQIWTLDTRNHSIAPGIDPLTMAPGSFHDALTWVIHFAAPTPHVVQANSLDGYASKPKFSVGYWCCQNCLSKLTWTSVK